MLAKQEKSECLFVSFFCFNTSVSMAKVSVLLGRVMHDFMQIVYFFVGFNFHCLGQELLDFFWFSIFSFRYPQCLHFLELLQYEHFRRELVNPACAKFIDEQQILHWQYYCRRRMRMTLPKPGQTGSESSEQWWTQGKETKDKKKCIINSWVKTTSCKENTENNIIYSKYWEMHPRTEKPF